MNLQYKQIGNPKDHLIIKDIDDKQGIVSFYFANFGSRDSDNDVIMEGAYTKTIKENRDRIKHIKNHDINKPVGLIKNLYIDTIGAIAESQMSKSTDGRDALIMYSEGIITEHSQGFVTMKERFNDMEGFNEILEVQLWEVSTLTGWGANSNTPVLGIKSISNDVELKKAINLLKGLDNVLRKSKISDEKGAELNTIYNQLGETLESLKKDSEPLQNNTQKNGEPNQKGLNWEYINNNFKL